MRLKPVLFCAVSLYLFVSIQAVTAAASDDPCVLRTGLRDEVSTKYPARRVFPLADLGDLRTRSR